MAYGDYISCCKCETKLLYDGDRGNRRWWEERFGEEPQIKCPDCERKEIEQPSPIHEPIFERLKSIARLEASSDKKGFNLEDYLCGSFNEAYCHGWQDGRIRLARNALDELGIDWRVEE
jgi:hypothetical protein